MRPLYCREREEGDDGMILRTVLYVVVVGSWQGATKIHNANVSRATIDKKAWQRLPGVMLNHPLLRTTPIELKNLPIAKPLRTSLVMR